MPLIKAQLETQIQAKISTDFAFKKSLFLVSKTAMDRFQLAQKQALINAGTGFAFAAAQQAASVAFANEMRGLQTPIAKVVSEVVADGVDAYIKLGQVITPVPLVSTPAAIGAPVTIPVVPPGKIV